MRPNLFRYDPRPILQNHHCIAVNLPFLTEKGVGLAPFIHNTHFVY